MSLVRIQVGALMKTVLIAFLLCPIMLIFSGEVHAHKDSCHRWHSCPPDSNSTQYVCGDLGYFGGCPDSIVPPERKFRSVDYSVRPVSAAERPDPNVTPSPTPTDAPEKDSVMNNIFNTTPPSGQRPGFLLWFFNVMSR